MNSQSNRLNRAQEFARNAHSHLHSVSVSGIARPNIHHIQEVADLVWISGGTDDEVIASWLHDCVEDTDITLDEVEKVFGTNVAQIVDGLTDHRDFKGMDLPTRKGLQAERLKGESTSVHRVKIADQTSNIRSLALDPISDMTHEECYNYICGAKLLADECRGVSELLDNLFDQFYKKGLERYGDN
jgi:guanosine-3',5'-bis(diphosphate) 3'-pyrophosphohydrolase